MARIVKEEEHKAKRDEILDAAFGLVLSKGYERVSIQDILDKLQISKGALYHYFDSKQALLDGFVERIREDTEKLIHPVIHDPRLNAVEKLRGFLDAFDRFRVAHRTDVIRLARVWYADANALVRQKVDEAVRAQRTPWLSQIIHQGVAEGVFSTTRPDQAGRVVMALLQGMAENHAALLFSGDRIVDEAGLSKEIVAIHATYMDAIERVLGAAPSSLSRANPKSVTEWITALSKE